MKQQESQAVRDAEEAARAEAEEQDQRRWQGGQAETFDQETQRLLTEAAKQGPNALRDGRAAALRLLARGGPWAQTAAVTALSGPDPAVRLFVSTALGQAVEQDDRAGLGIIAGSTDRPAQQAAAFATQTGTHQQVKEFLRLRNYPGKVNDDRKQVNQVMAAAGPDSLVHTAGNEALNADSRGDAEALHRFLETGRFTAAKADDRRQVNKILAEAQRDGLREVAAGAQAALSGPDSYVTRFLHVELPQARLRDADTATHRAQIDSYLARADQSSALARQNANLAAEHAAIARQAADEAARWAAKAQESAEQAKIAADSAKASAEAAQRSADQAAQSAKRARDAAANAAKSARSADASAARASASATRANTAAAAAQRAAEAARADAIQAGKDAEAAERAAQEAKDAAARFHQVSEQRENVGEVPKEKDVSPFGIEKVPENMKDTPTVDPKSARCWGSGLGFGASSATCFYKVDHHITGTLRFFTFDCPPGATGKGQCRRVEVGTSPIDFHYTTEQMFNTAVVAGQVLLALAKGMIDDFIRCATDTGWGQAEACAWTAAALFPPARILRFGEMLANSARATVWNYREAALFLPDGKTGIHATLDNAGSMSVVVENATGVEAVGGKFFSTVMDHFGSRVKAVEGNWYNGDNLSTFNKLIREKKTPEDAARGTFTGKMAGRYGFTKVEVLKREGTPGEYTKVEVRFS
ncbi:hypothetical protein [Crossiella sp. NPDC003009]